MTSQELRLKFINFFKNHSDLPHQEIPSASLIPSSEQQLEGKERVLFTSAGMQPLIPYLTGQKEPPNKRLVNVQKCLRTDDIEQVGDEVHHTFFEMLGNWSIGDYWKEGAIELSFEFLTKELDIPVEKLGITVFAGDEDAPKDEESAEVWKSLGIPEDRIFYFGKSHNWWPTARREQDSGEYKNPFGPCGPDTEMFYWIGEGEPEGRPNEDSRWVEIWNDVFMQFNRQEDGILEELPQKNVDTGMGLERTLAVLNSKKSDYETDLFFNVVSKLESKSHKFNLRDARVVADHIKAAIFLASEGIQPSNKDQGYVLRRLIRRSEAKASYGLGISSFPFTEILNIYIEIYKDAYPEILNKKEQIDEILLREIVSFHTTLERAFKEFEQIKANNPKIIPGDKIFYLHATHGLTFEIIKDIADSEQIELDEQGFKEEFSKHQELSKSVSAGMFKGGLADHSEIVTKYHTATHLLHQALRDVLGPQVFQKGSNITSERTRFDFSYDKKMTDEEIKQVEDIVNKKIAEDLKVDRKIVSPEEAKKLNAIGLFDKKYGSEVSIYGVGPDYQLDPKAKDQRVRSGYYSLEFCGGPHVERTGIIGKINRGTILQGKIKITKEEAISSGIRRIRAEIVLR